MKSRFINETSTNLSSVKYVGNTNAAYPCMGEHYYHCAVFVICSIIFVAGFLGNCAVICIVQWKKEFQKKTTFVSIYLLAVSDLVSLSISYWREMVAGYYVRELTIFECTVFFIAGTMPYFLSCFSVAMLAIVRFDAVVFPLKASRLKTRSFIIILYLSAVVILSIIMTAVGRYSLENMSCYDTIYYNENLVFLFPPATIATIVLLLILHFVKIQQFRTSLSVRTHNVRTSIRRMNIVIYVVMCGFIVCQMPYIMFDFVEIFEKSKVQVIISQQFIDILLCLGIVFHLLNHAANPFVYFISFYISKQKTHNGN